MTVRLGILAAGPLQADEYVYADSSPWPPGRDGRKRLACRI